MMYAEHANTKCVRTVKKYMMNIIMKLERIIMEFEEFISLDTLKQRELAYYRLQFQAFKDLATIVQQNEKIVKLLEKLNGVEE